MKSRSTGKPCPVKGCTRHAKPHQLMCWLHWRRVPKAINHAVFESFANRLEHPDSYIQARDAAIAAVEEKERREPGDVL